MVSITGRASSVLLKVLYTYVSQKQNRKKKEEEQNKNRPINLPQGNNIVHILRVHYLPLNFIIHNKYNQLYIYICTYSRRQYKVSVTYRLLTVPYFLKMPSKTVPFYSAGHDAILLLYAIRI